MERCRSAGSEGHAIRLRSDTIRGMKHLFVLLLLLLTVGLVLANCPAGSTFVGNGNYFCGYDQAYVTPDNPSGFFCEPYGQCVEDCPDCLDTSCSCFAMAAIKPTATTKVEKRGKGMRVIRMVVHTERKLKVGAPHVWIIVDPATKLPAMLTVPQPANSSLSSTLRAILALNESAFAEQFK